MPGRRTLMVQNIGTNDTMWAEYGFVITSQGPGALGTTNFYVPLGSNLLHFSMNSARLDERFDNDFEYSRGDADAFNYAVRHFSHFGFELGDFSITFMADTRIIQRGVAKVETTSGVLDAYIGVAIQSMKAKHNWDEAKIKDFAGFEFGWDGRNSHIILTVNMKLTAALSALAIANGAFLLEFAQVNISGADLAVDFQRGWE